MRHYILIGNKKYDYTLEPKRSVTLVVCKGANIADRFPHDEIPRLLAELPRIIMENRAHADAASEVVRFRITPAEKQAIETRAFEQGFDSVSSYLRAVALGEDDTG